MPPKRKDPFSASLSGPPAKKAAFSSSSPLGNGTKLEQIEQTTVKRESSIPPEEEYGIVQREFYPLEMSSARCEQYNNNEIPRPIEVLSRIIDSTASVRNKIKVKGAVVHWFKRDLRTIDNRALHLASEKAKNANVPLICLFIVSPQDYQAHLTSAIRVDFELRTLAVLKQDLAEKNIPLYIETIADRKTVPARIVELCESWSAAHLFCNIEYEVDELRRETTLTTLCLARSIAFTAVHDDAVVAPGILATQAGKQFSVYSPWYRAWLAHLHANPEALTAFPSPHANAASARETLAPLFGCAVPSAPGNKTLATEEEKTRFARLWPAGEHEALARLDKFITSRVGRYAGARNQPAENGTSSLSVHFSAGTLAARTAVRRARDSSGGSSGRLDGGGDGVKTWISEIAWRDFYKHVLAHWPYVCMHKPFKHTASAIRWEYNDAHFAAWRDGQTGYPIIDAAMRQLKQTGYMHNRARMITASFLSKDLLLDWRLGERHFMLSLIDGDFASNSGGWGFSASVGVDPQPYFRVFNSVLQSEKFDPGGEYIRKWVPELRDLEGSRAVHDPYGRGEGARVQGRGYPRMIVGHAEARTKALERYKEGSAVGAAGGVGK